MRLSLGSALVAIGLLPVAWATAGTGGPVADVRVSMTDDVLRATAGQALTYEVQVFNPGPDTATAVTVMGFEGTGITHGGWTCMGFSGGICTAPSGSGTIGTTVDLPVGGLVVFTLSATVGATPPPLVRSEVIAGPPAGGTDPTIENNRGVDTDNVGLDMAQLVHGYDETHSVPAAGLPFASGYFWISQEPFASYEVVVDATSGDIGGANGPSLERLAGDATLTLQTALPVGAGPSRSLRWRTQSGVFRIDDQFIRVMSQGCTGDCGPDDRYRIRAYETTYTVTRFNNSGSQVTVLLLQNTTTDTVAGTIYFWRATGAPFATFGFNLPARQSMVLNTATVAPGQGGALTITNDGSYGALAGKTVALEPDTGFSFDTPLLPRPR